MQMHQKTRRLGLFSHFLETSFSSVFIEGRDSSWPYREKLPHEFAGKRIDSEL